jgi:tetratricopeptide (TPR) repeat protein
MQVTINQALTQAVTAYKAGNLTEAERIYKAILQSQPAHAEANHNLGVLAASVNKTEYSLTYFKAALEADSKIEQFWYSYIDALVKNSQVNDAKQAIKKAKKKGFDAKKLQALLSQSKGVTDNKVPSQKLLNSLLEHYKNGRFNDAEKLAISITNEYPKHQFAWKVLGPVLAVAGKKSEALDANQKAVALSPQDAEAHNNLGNTLKELVRFEEAKATYTQAIALKPDFAEAHYNLGDTLKELGRLEEAAATYTQAITFRPDFAEAHYNLGNTYRLLGRFAEAEARYNQAIALKPNFVEAHYNLGATLQKLGRLDEAEASYTQAIALKPDYAEAHNNLGVMLQKLRRLGEAAASYNQVIAAKPDYADAHSNLGITLQELGRLDEAEASYKQAILLKPDYAEAHYNLGNTLHKLGRLDEAEASYTQAITLKPDLAEAHSNLGSTLKELGRLEEAEASHTKAIALKPDFAEAHYNLGNTCRLLGRFDEAEASYNQAIALRPHYAQAHNQLLDCLFVQDKKSMFFDELDYLINQDKASSIIGSLACRSTLKYGLEKPNLFCTKPLNYVLHNDLNTRYDFEKTFVEKTKSILNENEISNRRQSLLVNGDQTSGNIFDIKHGDTNEIQNIIRIEVEKYRTKYKESEEGLIKKMPAEYSLSGWFISMKNGGNLKPHIHTEGWLSGSIYINVPPKLEVDSGNLVVSLGEENDAVGTRINEKKIIDVVTGSMVLFPASLMHYTIPFESEEERIVLAFDVKEK